MTESFALALSVGAALSIVGLAALVLAIFLALSGDHLDEHDHPAD